MMKNIIRNTVVTGSLVAAYPFLASASSRILTPYLPTSSSLPVALFLLITEIELLLLPLLFGITGCILLAPGRKLPWFIAFPIAASFWHIYHLTFADAVGIGTRVSITLTYAAMPWTSLLAFAVHKRLEQRTPNTNLNPISGSSIKLPEKG